jgi:hypothetical protein
MFESTVELLPRTKVLSTYHPASLLPSRMPEQIPVVRFDLKRLRSELAIDGFQVPKREVVVMHPDDYWTHQSISKQLDQMEGAIATDIEGYVDWISCIGFSNSPDKAYVVPIITCDGQSVWSPHVEIKIWEAIERTLTDHTRPKVLQNALYDCFVLAWSYGIVVRPVQDDTMIKHFELYCELEKSLAFQTSIYTKQPFYKWMGKKGMKHENHDTTT